MMKMDDTLYDKLDAIALSAKEKGMTMTQYAIRWALEQPAVVSAIVGVKRNEQIDDALGAIR